MFQLDTLKKLVKKRKRVGRGGSRGGTSGKGHKGQKARSGSHGVGYGFEGGQMPLARRLPKRGFKNTRFETVYEIVNLEDLDRVFKDGDEVTIEKLYETRLVSPKKSAKGKKALGIKILGKGDISKKLTIYADAASIVAQEAVKKAGGSIELSKEK
jgi:large subunit ribosomal protein L15